MMECILSESTPTANFFFILLSGNIKNKKIPIWDGKWQGKSPPVPKKTLWARLYDDYAHSGDTALVVCRWWHNSILLENIFAKMNITQDELYYTEGEVYIMHMTLESIVKLFCVYVDKF